MPRRIDMSRFLYVHECDVRRNSDMSVGDVHCRTDVCGFGSDMFSQSDLRLLSIMYRNSNLPIAGNVHRFADVSRHRDVPRGTDLRSAANVSSCSWMRTTYTSGRTIMSWLIDMSRLLYLPRRKLRGIPDMLESHLHIRTDLHTAFINLLVYANLPSISVVRGDGDLRSSAKLCGIVDVSGSHDMSGDFDVRAAGAYVGCICKLSRISDMSRATHVLSRDLMRGRVHMSAVSHLRRIDQLRQRTHMSCPDHL